MSGMLSDIMRQALEDYLYPEPDTLRTDDAPPATTPRGNGRKRLSDDDVRSFAAAAADRAPNSAKQREEFLKWVGAVDGRRLRRLGRDLDWLRRMATKAGLDPESIRWFL